jgi:hypothetical protein
VPGKRGNSQGVVRQLLSIVGLVRHVNPSGMTRKIMRVTGLLKIVTTDPAR